MKVSASLQNSEGLHHISLRTNDNIHSVSIPPKPGGFGSSLSGGELLFLALATCYCNDIYREAAKRNIKVAKVEVEVWGDFGGEGQPATNVSYRAKVTASGSESQLRELLAHTDRVAEIQNTLRQSTPVKLTQVELVSL